MDAGADPLSAKGSQWALSLATAVDESSLDMRATLTLMTVTEGSRTEGAKQREVEEWAVFK
jgi:hypothetical protein